MNQIITRSFPLWQGILEVILMFGGVWAIWHWTDKAYNAWEDWYLKKHGLTREDLDL